MESYTAQTKDKIVFPKNATHISTKSEPAITMSFDNPMLSGDLYGISFYAPGVLTYLIPTKAALHSFTLLTLYSISLCMIMLALKLLLSHQYISLAIVYVIHALGYLPLLIIMGSRPFTLFGNALLKNHRFSDNNGSLAVPTLSISYTLFVGIILAALILTNIFISIKKFNRGGNN